MRSKRAKGPGGGQGLIGPESIARGLRQSRLPKCGSYFSDARPYIDAKGRIRGGLRVSKGLCYTRKRGANRRDFLDAGGNEEVFHATVQALRPFFTGAGHEARGPRDDSARLRHWNGMFVRESNKEFNNGTGT